MTVDQMLFMSRLLLGLTIVGVVASVCLFFLLEINKAVHVVTGRTYKMKASPTGQLPNTKQIKPTKKTAQNGKGDEQKTRVLHTQENNGNVTNQATAVLTRVLDMSMQDMKGYDPTVILNNGELEQTVLLEPPKNKIDMLVDITYVHTEVII